MGKKPKILVAGSFVMDLIATTAEAPKAGETVVGRSFHTAPGGKGANQAVQCARLGAEVTMVGQVGNDAFGREMLDTAQAAGVDVSHVSVDAKTASGIGHVLLEVKGDKAQNRITAIPGANFTMQPEQVSWLKDEIHGYDMVLLQLEIPLAVNEAIAEMARAAGVPVMLNPAPIGPLSEKLLSRVDWLSPNEYEAAAITGCPLESGEAGVDEGQLQATSRALLARGVAQVVITLGGNGSAVACEGELLRVPPVKMERVADPTAAGDSFVGGLCTGLCAGLSRAAALNFASTAAALTVTALGAMPSLPTLAQVEALLQERHAAAPLPSELACLRERAM